MLSAIYCDYPESQPPTHPGPSWTRFVCISDTHSMEFPVPPGDVLLHAGDLSSWGSYSQLLTTIDWLKGLPHGIKVIVAGNHDLCLDRDLSKTYQMSDAQQQKMEIARNLVLGEEARKAGIQYVEHESFSLNVNGMTWKGYGSPAVPRYVNGSFQYTSKEEAKEIWSRIPDDVEILITHTPAHGILDKTRRGVRAGCPVLTERLRGLQQCRLHVFGHIHESHGAQLIKPRGTTHVERVSVNAALADEGQAIIIDLRKTA